MSTASGNADKQTQKALLKARRIRNYLGLYNTVSAITWGCLLVRIAVLLPLIGTRFLPEAVADFAAGIQTFALLDILHSGFKITRSNLKLTVLTIWIRLFTVWGVVDVFKRVSWHPTYSTMLITWSISGIINYSYNALTIRNRGFSSRWFVFLRYSHFYLSLPISTICEMSLVFLSLKYSKEWSINYTILLRIWLVLYIPLFYYLFDYYHTQRQRILYRNLNH